MVPVFEVNREALVLTVEEAAVALRATESIETPVASLKRLTERGIQSRSAEPLASRGSTSSQSEA